MSSSVDWFDCPKCGRGTASRDQDNRSGDTTYSCKCGWKGEPVEDDERRPATYTKYITGQVAQTFELVSGQYICKSQEFVSGDQVDREDENAEPVSVDDWEEPEVYFPMEMKQPE